MSWVGYNWNKIYTFFWTLTVSKLKLHCTISAENPFQGHFHPLLVAISYSSAAIVHSYMQQACLQWVAREVSQLGDHLQDFLEAKYMPHNMNNRFLYSERVNSSLELCFLLCHSDFQICGIRSCLRIFSTKTNSMMPTG